MTVTTTLVILAVVAIPIALLFGVVAQARGDLEIQQRINKHNNAQHEALIAALINAVLHMANITELPKLNATKWSLLCDLYDEPDLMPYEIPAQITTDHDDRPAVYWKVTNPNELDDYVLVRLWLAGII